MSLPEKKVIQLIDLMNSMSSANIPAKKPILEMFDIAMDEKMLDYLIAMGTKPHTIGQLRNGYHKMYGGTKEDWEAFKTELFSMAFVHPVSEEDREHVALSPIFPGWIEFATGGPLNEKRAAIINKFVEFWGVLRTMNVLPMRFLNDYKTASLGKKGIAPRTSVYVSEGNLKEVALNKPLESKQKTIPAGEVKKLLEKYKDEIAVMNCFCRQYKNINDMDPCNQGLPLETCMSLGAISTQIVENGGARRVSYEEAVEMLDDFEKKGCIHTTFHHANDANKDEMVICNCCTDCCLMYNSWREGSLSKIYTRSFFSPKMLDESKCVGCNICGKYCPTEATYYDAKAKKLVFHYEKCVGCGQCVNQCKFDVREMVKDERDVFVKTKNPKKL
ncbi:MAG: 4Fe-4S binding protein [Lachnospiraceae bacterium]|nr:4Fe-4S binding protein [Lachnospiraceae bacterium]